MLAGWRVELDMEREEGTRRDLERWKEKLMCLIYVYT